MASLTESYSEGELLCLGSNPARNIGSVNKIELMANEAQRVVSSLKSKGQIVLERCIQCHKSASSQVIPRISFDNFDDLKEELVANDKRLLHEISRRTNPNAGLDYSMPFGMEKLTKEERESLMDFLESLVVSDLQ